MASTCLVVIVAVTVNATQWYAICCVPSTTAVTSPMIWHAHLVQLFSWQRTRFHGYWLRYWMFSDGWTLPRDASRNNKPQHLRCTTSRSILTVAKSCYVSRANDIFTPAIYNKSNQWNLSFSRCHLNIRTTRLCMRRRVYETKIKFCNWNERLISDNAVTPQSGFRCSASIRKCDNYRFETF